MKTILQTITGFNSYDEIRILQPIRFHQEQLKSNNINIQQIPLRDLSEQVARKYDIVCLHGLFSVSMMPFINNPNINFCLFIDDLMWDTPQYNPIRHNKIKLEVLRQSLRKAKAIVATTHKLKEEIVIYSNVDADIVYVAPNMIESVGEMSESNRVLWAGGNSHFGDLKLLDNYNSDRELVFFGKHIPIPLAEFRVNEYGDVFVLPKDKNVGLIKQEYEYEKYNIYMNNIHAGIGLCPLQSNKFNDCKSIWKYLEYSQRGMVSVTTDTMPYSMIPDDAVTKIRDNDWGKGIENAIKNRKDIYQNMRNYVQSNYTYNSPSDNWINTYKSI